MLAAVTASLTGVTRNGSHVTPDAETFARCPSELIDYAIMEHAARVACVPVNMGWPNVGNWDSLHAVSLRDSGGNAVRGKALAIGASNCPIHTDGPRVPLMDVDDLIVVVSQGEVMVLRRGDSQKVKQVTEAIKAEGRRPRLPRASAIFRESTAAYGATDDLCLSGNAQGPHCRTQIAPTDRAASLNAAMPGMPCALLISDSWPAISDHSLLA